MVAIKIVRPFIKSGDSFPIQLMRATRGDVTLTIKVANKARDFSVNDSAAQPRVTVTIPGGAPRNFLVSDWGTATQGTIITLTAVTTDGEKDFDSATVGP